jgi:hypothetical protein
MEEITVDDRDARILIKAESYDLIELKILANPERRT